MLAKDKRSSLLWKVVTYGRKKFYNIGPSGLYYKTSMIVMTLPVLFNYDYDCIFMILAKAKAMASLS